MYDFSSLTISNCKGFTCRSQGRAPLTRPGTQTGHHSLWRKVRPKISAPPGQSCIHTLVFLTQVSFVLFFLGALGRGHLQRPPYWEGWETRENPKTLFPTHDSVPSTFQHLSSSQHTPSNLLVHKTARDLFRGSSRVRWKQLSSLIHLTFDQLSHGGKWNRELVLSPLNSCLLPLSKWLKV